VLWEGRYAGHAYITVFSRPNVVKDDDDDEEEEEEFHNLNH
jgi:hypothetical protein